MEQVKKEKKKSKKAKKGVSGDNLILPTGHHDHQPQASSPRLSLSSSSSPGPSTTSFSPSLSPLSTSSSSSKSNKRNKNKNERSKNRAVGPSSSSSRQQQSQQQQSNSQLLLKKLFQVQVKPQKLVKKLIQTAKPTKLLSFNNKRISSKRDTKFIIGVLFFCLFIFVMFLISVDLDPYNDNASKIATLDSIRPHVDDTANYSPVVNDNNNNQQQQQQQQQQNYNNNDPKAHPDHHNRIEYFRDVARDLNPTTDKIGITSEHRYHNMYGMFLLPYAANKPTMKMLEIGLGCNMAYGAGASVALWKKLFPLAELWEAEYDTECVTNAKQKGQLQDINVLVGDQANLQTLDNWIQQSGGQFDIIIDDGGHHNCQMYNSYKKLWPQIVPGGLYFIEDLHTSNWDPYIGHQCDNVLMRDLLINYADQLIFKTTVGAQMLRGGQVKHELPNDVQFVHCIAEACVIGKNLGLINDPWKPHKRDIPQYGRNN